MLSQSLRDLVGSKERSSHEPETNVSQLQGLERHQSNEKGKMSRPQNTSSKKKMIARQKLEKLYDLDTSRFEEECSKMPSS